MELDFEILLAKYGGKQRVYHKQEIIYNSESGVQGIYFLKSGKIRIDNSRIKTKKEVLVWLLTSGNFFGISSFYTGYTTCEYVTTVVSDFAEVILISHEEFIHLLTANKDVRDYIINILYRRLDYIEIRKCYTTKIPLRKRVVEALIFLSPSHLPPEIAFKGQPYKILIAIQELAKMINSTRNELNLIIDDLTNKRILDRDGEGIIIKNVGKLLSLK